MGIARKGECLVETSPPMDMATLLDVVATCFVVLAALSIGVFVFQNTVRL